MKAKVGFGQPSKNLKLELLFLSVLQYHVNQQTAEETFDLNLNLCAAGAVVRKSFIGYLHVVLCEVA